MHFGEVRKLLFIRAFQAIFELVMRIVAGACAGLSPPPPAGGALGVPARAAGVGAGFGCSVVVDL